MDGGGVEGRGGIARQGMVLIDTVPIFISKHLGIEVTKEMWSSVVQQISNRIRAAMPPKPSMLPELPAPVMEIVTVTVSDDDSEIVTVPDDDSEAPLPMVSEVVAVAPSANVEMVPTGPTALTKYDGLSVSRLQSELVLRDNKISQLRELIQRRKERTKKIFRQQKSVLKENTKKMQLTVVNKPGCDALVLTRRGKIRLSDSGACALAIRRAHSNIAAADLGKVLLDDVSRYTVCRAEVLTASSLCIAAKAYYSDVSAKAAKSDFSIILHSVMSDATNSNIWKKQKLHSCIVKSLCCTEMPPVLSGDYKSDIVEVSKRCVYLKRVADVLPCTDGSALGLLALLDKQFKSIGCPTWQQLVELARSHGS